MKIKSKLAYNLFKIFPKRFIKLFDKFYSHKLSYNLLKLIEKGMKIDFVYDVGAYRGEWSNFLNETSLKDKKFF